MTIKRLLALPDLKDREMVRPRRTLEEIQADIALILAAVFHHPLKESRNIQVASTDIDMGQNNNCPIVCRRRCRTNLQRPVWPLVIGHHSNWIELHQHLFRMRRHSMRIERFLIGPFFHQRKMSRPSNLLEQLEADEAFILPARLTVLLER